MTTIYPSLTNQIVLEVFELLVNAELKKKQKGAFEFQFGHQEGIISTVSLLFGTTETHRDDSPANNWIRLTERIVQEELKDWALEIENVEDFEDVDEIDLKKDIKKAVETFALKDPTQLTNALKSL